NMAPLVHPNSPDIKMSVPVAGAETDTTAGPTAPPVRLKLPRDASYVTDEAVHMAPDCSWRAVWITVATSARLVAAEKSKPDISLVSDPRVIENAPSVMLVQLDNDCCWTAPKISGAVSTSAHLAKEILLGRVIKRLIHPK